MGAVADFAQNLMQSNPRRADWFQRHLSEGTAERLGRRKAMGLFHEASTKVAAYRRFLAEHGVDPTAVRSFDDFQALPMPDKSNYLVPNRERLEDLVIGGKITDYYAIGRSSGYSGEPLFWPRTIQQEKSIAAGLEMLVVTFRNADRIPTLLVVCFDLGMWVGGEMAAHSARTIAKKRHPITATTPGSDIDETLAVVRNLSHMYEQTMIMGYPPYLRQLLERGEEEGIRWKDLNVSLLAGGEGYSEEWRLHMLQRIGKEHDLTAIMGGFGSSEGMLVGLEQPLTIVARRLGNQDESLREDLYGPDANCYALVQYSPVGTYVEIIDGEMVLTSGGAVPLVRYNGHDLAGTIGFERFMSILADHGYGPERLRSEGVDLSRIWKNPFLYSLGRNDSVSVDGANIYAEGISPALFRPGMEGISNWKLAIHEVEDQLQLMILVELQRGIAAEEAEVRHSRSQRYSAVFLDQLNAVNPDFRSAYRNNPDSLTPHVVIYEYGRGPFSGDEARIKQRHVYRGLLDV
jgi:phenylacetate-CoA ligase